MVVSFMNLKLVILFVCLLSATTLFGADLNIEIDPQISEVRREILQEAINKANHLKIDIEKASPKFKAIFGDSGSITHYINNRIFYVIDDKSDGSYVRPFLNGEALNLGTALYFAAISKGYKENNWSHNGELIKINSPQIGIVQLNSDFFSKNKSVLERISILIHEARHSDCEMIEDAPTELCGYPHHQEDQIDKDKYAEGAYEMSYLFADAIANACINCSEDEKFIGLVIWSSEQSKIKNKNP
jgi:hypothetical protein